MRFRRKIPAPNRNLIPVVETTGCDQPWLSVLASVTFPIKMFDESLLRETTKVRIKLHER
jgi:hypothetical protein